MAELFLVRHAQASFGSENYDKLSELGHQQSLHLSEYFAQRKLVFDRVITGDMIRHKETAQGIVGSLAITEVDAGWNEFDFNAVVNGYLSLYPEHKPAKNSPRSDWYRVLKLAMLAWSEQKLSHLDEDWVSFETRVHNASKAIFESPHQRVLVVSSGGAIAICIMQMLGLNIQKAIDVNLQIKNTSIHHIYFNKANAQLSSFNNVPHLDHPQHQHLITYS